MPTGPGAFFVKRTVDQTDAGLDDEARRVLVSGLDEMGYSRDHAASLMKYLSELRKWNTAYNLTAVRHPVEMVIRHLLDSVAILSTMRELAVSRVLDVGSGAGLPGIPIALLDPQLHVTVLDANGKKARFLRHVVRALDMGNVEVVESRVEAYRPARRFDCVTSRAFAELEKFVTATRHVIQRRGHWLAMTGRVHNNGTMDSPAPLLSEESTMTVRLEVPGLCEERHLVIIPSDFRMSA